MSVSEFESRKNTRPPISPVSQSKEHGAPDTNGWDVSLNGIISDFKGELSQLDPVSPSSLDLRDPSTPARRVAHQRAMAVDVVLSPSPSNKSFPSSPVAATTPTVTLQLASEVEEMSGKSCPSSPIRESTSIAAPIVPPRVSSLIAPIHSTPSSPRGSKQTLSPLRSRNVNSFGGLGTHVNPSSRDSSRLRIQHRSTASSSEPSLIRDVPESRGGELVVLLVIQT